MIRTQRDPDLYNAGWGRKRATPRPCRSSRQHADGLTPRELEVLRLLAEGLGRKEIASQLGISDNTAANHLTAIYDKFGPRTAAGAVAKALREGLIE